VSQATLTDGPHGEHPDIEQRAAKPAMPVLTSKAHLWKSRRRGCTKEGLIVHWLASHRPSRRANLGRRRAEMGKVWIDIEKRAEDHDQVLRESDQRGGNCSVETGGGEHEFLIHPQQADDDDPKLTRRATLGLANAASLFVKPSTRSLGWQNTGVRTRNAGNRPFRYS